MMKNKITRDEAWQLVQDRIQKPENILHLRESEEIMKALARKFGEDEELWGNAGLLHDLDYEEVTDNLDNHGPRTIEMLREAGYEIPELEQAILSHVEGMGRVPNKRESKLDYALAAGESISGFIVAVARVRPTKFEGLKVKSVSKKLKDKSFAAMCNREFINDIEKTGMDRAEFIQLAIDAVSAMQDEIGI